MTIRDSLVALDGVDVLTAPQLGVAAATTLENLEDAPLRTRRWVEGGGARAIGEDFLAASPLPVRTETEGYYHHSGRRVHYVAGVVLVKRPDRLDAPD